jgi:hypothetical protein
MKTNRLRKILALKASTNKTQLPIYQLKSDPGKWFYLDGTPYSGGTLPAFTGRFTLTDHSDARALATIYTQGTVFDKIRANYGINN